MAKADRILLLVVVGVLAAAAIVWITSRSPRPTETAVPDPDNLALLVVGIEGLEPSIMDGLIAEGRLPNVAALMERGATIGLEGLGGEVKQGFGWACVASGAVPVPKPVGWTKEEPGVRDPLLMRPTPLWETMSEHGHAVSVVGWPGTWPAVDINGVMVGPYVPYVGARDHGEDLTPSVRPVTELPKIDPLIIPWEGVPRRWLGRFFQYDGPLGYEALTSQNFAVLQQSAAGDRSMLDVSRLVAPGDGGSLFVFLPGLNGVTLRFWLYWDPNVRARALEFVGDQDYFLAVSDGLSVTIERYYEFIDEALGLLMGWVAEDGTIAVVSDHGFVPVEIDDAGRPTIGAEVYSDRGICVIAGPRVVGGARVDDASIRDVAPTIAEAANLPAPPQAEGEVLGSVLTTP